MGAASSCPDTVSCRHLNHFLAFGLRCGQPGQQQGLRLPLPRSSHKRSMCFLRVSGFLTIVVQQIHSLRARAVRSFQFTRISGFETSASRKSAGTRCTTPEATTTFGMTFSGNQGAGREKMPVCVFSQPPKRQDNYYLAQYILTTAGPPQVETVLTPSQTETALDGSQTGCFDSDGLLGRDNDKIAESESDSAESANKLKLTIDAQDDACPGVRERYDAGFK